MDTDAKVPHGHLTFRITRRSPPSSAHTYFIIFSRVKISSDSDAGRNLPLMSTCAVIYVCSIHPCLLSTQ